MPNFLAFLAPIALVLPPVGQGAVDRERDTARLDPAFAEAMREGGSSSVRLPLDAPYGDPVQHQVRIEQRVIVRISPQPQAARQSMMAELPQRPVPRRLEERKMEKCVPIGGIAGVQTGSGNRLLLYLTDRRVVTANLEKACRARDFYSGFYIERNKDGMLCVDRDKLQSRSGANCELKRMRQLVPVSD